MDLTDEVLDKVADHDGHAATSPLRQLPDGFLGEYPPSVCRDRHAIKLTHLMNHSEPCFQPKGDPRRTRRASAIFHLNLWPNRINHPRHAQHGHPFTTLPIRTAKPFVQMTF